MAEKKLADMTMEEIKIAGTVIGVDLSKNRGDKATLTKAFSDYFLSKNPDSSIEEKLFSLTIATQTSSSTSDTEVEVHSKKSNKSKKKSKKRNKAKTSSSSSSSSSDSESDQEVGLGKSRHGKKSSTGFQPDSFSGMMSSLMGGPSEYVHPPSGIPMVNSAGGTPAAGQNFHPGPLFHGNKNTQPHSNFPVSQYPPWWGYGAMSQPSAFQFPPQWWGYGNMPHQSKNGHRPPSNHSQVARACRKRVRIATNPNPTIRQTW